MYRIVIVCSPSNRENLQRIFQSNHEIEIESFAHDSLDALKICSETEINLILMVLTHNFEPANWIRLIQARHPDIKILIMIETLFESDMVSALRHGAAGYILLTDNSNRIGNAINLCLKGFITADQLYEKSLIPLIFVPYP